MRTFLSCLALSAALCMQTNAQTPAPNITVRPSAVSTAPSDVEALVQLTMSQAAQQAEADLRAMLEAMNRENARRVALRQQMAALRQQMPGSRARQRAVWGSSQPGAAVTPPADVCAAPTTPAWNACIDRIKGNIARASYSPTDRQRLIAQLEALRVEVDGAGPPEDVVRLARARELTTNLIAAADAP